MALGGRITLFNLMGCGEINDARRIYAGNTREKKHYKKSRTGLLFYRFACMHIFLKYTIDKASSDWLKRETYILRI